MASPSLILHRIRHLHRLCMWSVMCVAVFDFDGKKSVALLLHHNRREIGIKLIMSWSRIKKMHGPQTASLYTTLLRPRLVCA